MNDFTVNRFSGSTPRLASHLIQPGAAKRAVDCKLSSGQLDSFREPLKVRDVAETTATMFQHDCCWLEFDTCVDIAVGSVSCQQLFATGIEDYPYPVTITLEGGELCQPNIRRLGLPCPTRGPAVMPGAVPPAVDKDQEGRSYAYQYVNSSGERSALSPGSRAENLHDGQTVVVSGWQQPDVSWDVISVRIYRTVTGHQSGKEQGNLPDTHWMFVAEVGINAGSFIDNLFNDELLEALEEDIATPPPAGLQGIVWIESMNTLAGFIGNRIYFSENNKYHHWPHHMDLDDNVCAIVESRGVIYVATDGRPYVITGAVDCHNAACRSAVRLPGNFPMIGCGNRRMAKTASGAVYPSLKGLVSLSGNSMPALATWGFYSEDDWQEIMPESITPVEVGGRLYVFATNGAFTMQAQNGAESGWDFDLHSDLSDRGVRDAFVTRTGEFYILKEDGLWLWNQGEELRPHLWESHVHATAVPIGFGAGHLNFDFGAESVKIEVDGRTVIDREVLSTRVFRLPMWAFGNRWKFILTGTSRVSLLSMAPAMRNLG